MEYKGLVNEFYVFEFIYNEYDWRTSSKVKDIAKLVTELLGPKGGRWEGESFLKRSEEYSDADWITRFKLRSEEDAVLLRLSL